MARFALTLHQEKTRLIEFGRRAAANRERRGLGKPESFNFLGFTHICGRTPARRLPSSAAVATDRMRAKLHELKEELRPPRHLPIPKKGQWLQRVVAGWYNYHAVPTNIAALSTFQHHVGNLWRRALQRRSQRDCTTWAKMRGIIDRWLPTLLEGVIPTVGATSSDRLDFVEKAGVYALVCAYGNPGAIDREKKTLIVDFVGDDQLLATLRTEIGTSVARVCRVGGTHWRAATSQVSAPDVEVFFAPAHIERLVGEYVT